MIRTFDLRRLRFHRQRVSGAGHVTISPKTKGGGGGGEVEEWEDVEGGTLS